MISNVPPNSPLVVWDLDSYRAQTWDPIEYGISYDEQAPFFAQFMDLRLKVPQPGILRHPSNINYEYSLNGKNSKNVYCSSGIFDSEDVWYTTFATYVRQVMDSQKIYRSENIFEGIFSGHINNCHFVYYTYDSIDSQFLYDCRNCQDCFGCVNLRNKQFCWFNEQLTKEEYKKRLAELKLDTISGLKTAKLRFWEFIRSNPVLASRSTQAIDCEGVVIVNCKDCTRSVSIEKSEHERYCDSTISHKDSMDIYASGASQLMYESAGSGGQCANVKFAVISKSCVDCEYVINCTNCQSCFGCIGIENKKYCIFNKQYEPEDYYRELDKIKSKMLADGEYGEFLPYRFSAFAYNGSDVDVSYPLPQEEVAAIDALWQEYIEIDTSALKTISVSELPDSITDVTDDILSLAIICEVTGKPFRVIKTELEFYRRHKLPLPTVHTYERTKHKFSYMGNNLIRKGKCESCHKEIDTIYDVEDGWRLYCEGCYQREVL